LNKDAQNWISKLNLQEHPEGGYFVETYKSEKFVNLPEYTGPRNSCSAIYYLLMEDQFSSFHIMKSDELWHFYAGSSVKSGCWFAASINDHNFYSLVGCSNSPGFEYQDWKLGVYILLQIWDLLLCELNFIFSC
jgi:predicted cupin superfamily sugar epimerase